MDLRSSRPFVLLVLFLCADCTALKVSVVSPKTATLGSDTVLECTFVVGIPAVDIQHLAIIWRFKGKEGLRFNNDAISLDPRMSLDKTAIQNGNASLVLSKVAIEDEGMYTCAVIYTPATQEKDVMLKIQATPKIIIPEKSVIKGKENLLRCSVVGFYPKEIDVSWLQDGHILPGSSTSKLQRLANGTFMINCTLPLIPTDSDANHNFSCRIRHSSLQGYLQEDVQLLYKEEEKGRGVGGIIVSLLVVMAVLGWVLYEILTHRTLALCEIQGPQTWILGETVELVCVGHHCPKGIEIRWIKVHNGNTTGIGVWTGSEHQDTEPLMKQERYRVNTSESPEGLGYSTITSSLIITPNLKEDEGASFKCNFHTKNQEIKEEKEFKAFNIHGKPQVVEAIKCSPCDGSHVRCSMELQRFYPKEIKIKWSCGAGDLKDITSEEQETEGADYTFNIRTECTIPEEAFKDSNFRIRVSWEHASLGKPEYREISVKNPDCPVLEDISVPRIIRGVEAALQCRVRGYFLKELQVEWLKMEKGKGKFAPLADVQSGYKMDCTEPSYHPGEGYFRTTSLTFTPELPRDQGSEFICRMSHSTLEGPLERNTGELRILSAPKMKRLHLEKSPEKHPVLGKLMNENAHKTPESVTFQLHVVDFFPVEIPIEWSWGPPENLQVLDSTLITGASDGTYSAKSSCCLSKEQIKRIRKDNINVTIEHESLSDPLKLTVQLKDKGNGWKMMSQTFKWVN